MRTDELDFDLPPELIAQTPAPDRAASRLLHYCRSDKSIIHRNFSDLPRMLRKGDLLVFNDARVIPARFTLIKPTGGRVEGLFVSQTQPHLWTVMLKNLGPLKPGMKLHFADDSRITASAVEKLEEGQYTLRVDSDQPATALLSTLGRMPLPPYIKREKDHDERDDFDRERYQTVYARASGSIAAPTAGLHFTDQLLRELDEAEVQRTFVTLHVGLGTFKPVTADSLDQHAMHTESYSIPSSTADALNRAKSEGRRMIAVGTTSARVLESQPAEQPFRENTSATSIFIYPPYEWKHVSGLITNFHLPRSTLIALVAALVGIEQQRGIYREAIAHRYRFFSYGDAGFLE